MKHSIALRIIFILSICLSTLTTGHAESLPDDVDKGIEINGIDKAENTALMQAIKNKQTQIALYLIFNGADVNRSNNKNQTPLLIAAENGMTAVVKALLDQGADVKLSHKPTEEAERLA